MLAITAIASLLMPPYVPSRATETNSQVRLVTTLSSSVQASLLDSDVTFETAAFFLEDLKHLRVHYVDHRIRFRFLDGGQQWRRDHNLLEGVRTELLEDWNKGGAYAGFGERRSAMESTRAEN